MIYLKINLKLYLFFTNYNKNKINIFKFKKNILNVYSNIILLFFEFKIFLKFEMATIEELKDVLKETLEDRGVLSKIRA